MDVEGGDVPFDELDHVLNTVDGEICFFRSLMRARPIGMHRHFHVMAMQVAIEKVLKEPVSIDEIWQKLDTCYNMEQLDLIVRMSLRPLCFSKLRGVCRNRSMKLLSYPRLHRLLNPFHHPCPNKT